MGTWSWLGFSPRYTSRPLHLLSSPVLCGLPQGSGHSKGPCGWRGTAWGWAFPNGGPLSHGFLGTSECSALTWSPCSPGSSSTPSSQLIFPIRSPSGRSLCVDTDPLPVAGSVRGQRPPREESREDQTSEATFPSSWARCVPQSGSSDLHTPSVAAAAGATKIQFQIITCI